MGISRLNEAKAFLIVNNVFYHGRTQRMIGNERSEGNLTLSLSALCLRPAFFSNTTKPNFLVQTPKSQILTERIKKLRSWGKTFESCSPTISVQRFPSDRLFVLTRTGR